MQYARSIKPYVDRDGVSTAKNANLERFISLAEPSRATAGVQQLANRTAADLLTWSLRSGRGSGWVSVLPSGQSGTPGRWLAISELCKLTIMATDQIRGWYLGGDLRQIPSVTPLQQFLGGRLAVVLVSSDGYFELSVEDGSGCTDSVKARREDFLGCYVESQNFGWWGERTRVSFGIKDAGQRQYFQLSFHHKAYARLVQSMKGSAFILESVRCAHVPDEAAKVILDELIAQSAVIEGSDPLRQVCPWQISTSSDFQTIFERVPPPAGTEPPSWIEIPHEHYQTVQSTAAAVEAAQGNDHPSLVAAVGKMHLAWRAKLARELSKQIERQALKRAPDS